MISKKLRFAIFFLSLFISCYSQEVYDVETLPTLRTKQYAMEPYKKIVVFSAPRTGSSLVYNVLRFLFEDDSELLSPHNEFNLNRRVLKTHIFDNMYLAEKENCFCFFTMRHPYNAAVSHYRIIHRQIGNLEGFTSELMNRHLQHLHYSDDWEKKGKGIIRLKYEDFAHNLEFLFHVIENQFQIKIDLKDKELIRKGYSKENISLCTLKFVNFSEYLPISGFHGQHVSQGKYTPPSDFLYWLDFYLEPLKPQFQLYGYFNELI